MKFIKITIPTSQPVRYRECLARAPEATTFPEINKEAISELSELVLKQGQELYSPETLSLIKKLFHSIQAAINSNIAFEKWRSKVDQVQKVFQERHERKMDEQNSRKPNK